MTLALPRMAEYLVVELHTTFHIHDGKCTLGLKSVWKWLRRDINPQIANRS